MLLLVALVKPSTGDFPIADVLRSLAGRGDPGTAFICLVARLADYDGVRRRTAATGTSGP